MKRNMDLIRSLLLHLEESELNSAEQIKLQGYSSDEINYHLSLMYDAGYIAGQKLAYGRVIPMEISWEGHDFIEAIRKDSIWNKVKETIKNGGGNFTAEILKDLGIKFSREAIDLM